MRIADISVRHRVAVLAAVPLTASVALTAPFVVTRVHNAQQASGSAQTLSTARQVGQLIQDLQRERLVSIAYLAAGDAPVNPVVVQAAKVDSDAGDLAVMLDRHPAAGLRQALDGSLAGLRRDRPRVLDRTMAASELKQSYSEAITSLIDALGLTATVRAGTGSSESRDERTMDGLLRLNEDASRLGASLLALAADPRQIRVSVAEVISELAVTQSDSTTFYRSATASQGALVRAATGNRGQTAVIMVSTVRDWAYSSPDAQASRAVTGVGFTTAQILEAADAQDTLRQIAQEKISSDAAAQARADAESSARTALGFALGMLGLGGVMVGFGVSLSRSISRPLVRLRSAAASVVELAEAELARVTDEGSEQVAPVCLPGLEVTGRDEVGQLAGAFNRVQEVSVSLVERQVAGRRNAAAMLGNIGRRTQNLAGRQLMLIDELEREEIDPGRLERLYRLDHVSTRLRRHADSLVVLSGWSEPEVSGSPVALGDLLRSALGTIEGFQRVEFGDLPPVLIAPGIAADLVLVLAELLENAASFSPPTSCVTVSAQEGFEGWGVRITDRGVGMSPGRLAAENARLADTTERLDQASTEVLGLFVVGRLCRRHGLRVELHPTPGGGTTARVTLPRAHLLPAPTARPASLPPVVTVTAEPGGGLPAMVTVPVATLHGNPELPGPRGGTGNRPATAPAPASAARGPPAAAILVPLPPTGPGPALPATAGPGGLPRRTRPAGGGFSWFSRKPDSQDRRKPDCQDRPPHHRASAPPSAQPPGDRTSAHDVLPAPGDGGTARPGLVRRIPGAQLPAGAGAPRGGPRPGPTPHLDPDAARAMIEDFDEGIRRALGEAAGSGI